MNALTVNQHFSKLCLAILALGFILIAGCGGNLQTAINGIYVNNAKSEFSISEDTLILEKQQDENYLIHRRTGIKMLDESGKPGKLILEAEEWKAVYDPDKKLMTEQKKGRQIRFNMDGLLLENSLYRRIP